jgi:hypothetical protein
MGYFETFFDKSENRTKKNPTQVKKCFKSSEKICNKIDNLLKLYKKKSNLLERRDV